MEERNPARARKRRLSTLVTSFGVSMLIVGALLLAAVGVYHALGLYSSTQLDELNVKLDVAPSLPRIDTSVARASESAPAPAPVPAMAVSVTDAAEPPAPQTQLPLHSYLDTTAPVGSMVSLSRSSAQPEAAPGPGASPVSFESVSTYASFPATQVHPKYWHQPMWAGTDVYTALDTSATNGFIPTAQLEIAPKGSNTEALRIAIPAIGVDSDVSELAILDLGDRRRYETPNQVVGHIPGTANPGEQGNGWFFGHLESPVAGEGNVFKRLPDIARMLTNGDNVYVSVTNDGGVYLYQVVESRVVHHSELWLYDSADATITLVTCSNRPYYDYRQVVTATLVGFRPGERLN